jgi:hypothetical protein
MLNFCSIVAAILKMVTGRNFSMSGINTGHHNLPTRHNPCEHSMINILQWILTKLGTYLVLKRIWNSIDFQGQRSRSQGQIFTA